MRETTKTTLYTHKLSAVFLLIACVLFTSCEKVDLGTTESDKDNGGTSSQGSHKVTVIARSSSAQEMNYPIDIYAYDAEGKEAGHQTISTASENISLSLNEGQYTLAAISGASAFDKTKGYSTTPVMTGSTAVTVGSSAVTANIVLSYAVCALDVSLNDVPTSVTTMTVAVASQYTDVTNLREYSGTSTVTIPCSRSGNTWQTGTVYLLPGCKESTVLTISLTSPTGTTSYGITYPDVLKAATPYHFTGSYSGDNSGVKLTGTFTMDNWLTAVDGSFSFGPGGQNSFSGSSAIGTETVNVSSIPAQGTVWDNHLVALIDNETSEALLLSTTEWSSLTSALYESDPTVAQKIANSYLEGGLSGWSIPTSDQVRAIKEVWSSENLSFMNNALQGIGCDPLSVTDEEGKNVRYLCENASYTYSWAKGGSILSAGKTVKTYRLRVVKRVRFTI